MSRHLERLGKLYRVADHLDTATRAPYLFQHQLVRRLIDRWTGDLTIDLLPDLLRDPQG